MKKRIICLILCIISLVPMFALMSSAETEDVVLDELKNFTIDGKPFDESNYPLDSSDRNVYILAMREEGVTSSKATPDNLVLYYYNPSGDLFSDDTPICFGYLDFSKERKEDYSYSSSGTSGFYLDCKASEDYRFLKANISSSRFSGETHSDVNVRYYYFYPTWFVTDVGNNLSSDECLFTVTGFADTENLVYSNGGSLLMELDLSGTVWRDENPKAQDTPWLYNEVATVYFTVPREIYNQYNYIESIRASFNALHSTPIIVSNSSKFNSLENVSVLKSGYKITSYFDGAPTLDYGHLWFYQDSIGFQGPEWVYNPSDAHRKNYTKWATSDVYYQPEGKNVEIEDAISYYFYNPDIKIDANNNFYQAVSSDEFNEYVDMYTSTYGGYVDSGSMFAGVHTDLYDDAKPVDKIYTVSDFQLQGFKFNTAEERTFWDWLLGKNVGMSTERTCETIACIEDPQAIAEKYATDLDALSDTYLIGKADAEGFLKYLQNADGVVVLLRFEQTEYECRELGVSPVCNDGRVWLSRMWFYKDVDVVNVSFNRDGEIFTYDVNADSIDINGGVGVKDDIGEGGFSSIGVPVFPNLKFPDIGDWWQGLKDGASDFFGNVRDTLGEIKTVLGIVGIILVVGLAIWLIFKIFRRRQKVKIEFTPPSDNKRRRK